MDGSFLAVLFAVLISALGMENGIFLGVVLLFLYYPMRCVLERFLEQFVTHFSAHFFFLSKRARSLSLLLLVLLPSKLPLADLFSLSTFPFSFPLRARDKKTSLSLSQNVSREENRPLPSFPPETSVQKDT